MPPRDRFRYSFETFADVVDSLLSSVGATRYALYVMDYGAPVGYRLALKHPERVTALDRAERECLYRGDARVLEADQGVLGERFGEGPRGAAARHDARGDAMAVPGRRPRQLPRGSERVAARPGAARPARQRSRSSSISSRTTEQRRALSPLPGVLPRAAASDAHRVGEERRDLPGGRAHPYLRDLPDAEFHLLDTGHFALEDKGDEIALLMRDFLARRLRAAPASDR